jgi:hypothetical protein
VNRIADEVAENLALLEDGLWHEVRRQLRRLERRHRPEAEREVANFIGDHLKGFGPKQSRNLLQALGLTRYEIPIDSRISKWLSEFRFPIPVSTAALGGRDYYEFVLDVIQDLCRRCKIYPCVLDAAIFASFEKGD